MTRSLILALVALLATVPGRAQAPAKPADLVLRGGRIVTVDDAKPEARALAAIGDTIVAVGSEEEIQKYIGPSTKIVDLKGALAVPGLIDAHIHFTGVGEAARNLKLANAKSWADIVRMVGEAAQKARPGEWILGRGWHQEKWSEVPSPNVDGFPLHEALTRVSPNNPVWLTHASGHAGFANALAMKIAEVNKTTADPAGGQILKDTDGNPTGLLSAADIPRFGQLGVIASMEGIHCTSDAPYVLARLGPKRAEEGAYVWQKLMKSGATIANGTDAPVEDVDPIPSFYSSVSRRTKDGSVFYPDQRMSRMDALRSYTINAAYAGFEEGIKGSLTVGKLADITVLSKDLLTIPDDQIPSTRVLFTIVGGKVQYTRPADSETQE